MSNNILTIANLNSNEVLDIYKDPITDEKRIITKTKPEPSMFFNITKFFNFSDILFQMNEIIQNEIANPKILTDAISKIEVRFLHFNNKLCNIARQIFKIVAYIFGYDIDKAYADLIHTLRHKHVEAITQVAIDRYDPNVHSYLYDKSHQITPNSEEFVKLHRIVSYENEEFASDVNFNLSLGESSMDWTNANFIEEYDDLYKLNFGYVNNLMSHFDEIYEGVKQSHQFEGEDSNLMEVSQEEALLGSESVIYDAITHFTNMYRCARGFSSTIPDERVVDPNVINHPDSAQVQEFYTKGTTQNEWREMYNCLVEEICSRFTLSNIQSINKDFYDLLEVDESPESFDL